LQRFFFILILINVYIISPLLFIDLLLFSILIYLFHNKIGNKVSAINYKRQLENANLSNLFLEILNGKNDIIIFNLYNKVSCVINQITRKIKKQIRSNAIYQGLSDVFLEILILLFIISIVFILLQQEFPLSNIVTTIGFIAPLLWPLKGINDYLMSLNVVLPSINRIEQVLKKIAVNRNTETRKIIPSDTDISLTMRDISFNYGDKVIFDKSSFFFKRGVFLISGKNGSGKSTLAKLILGVLSIDNGEILITVKDTSNAMGLVSQTPFLYNNTIRENLKIREDITNKNIDSVINNYHLKEKFNFDLEKIVGENGKNLSGGEKQVISILRGLIMNPDILILDEITNNLPSKVYEGLIQKIISKREDLMTIIISHHIIKSIQFDEIIKINTL